MLTALRKHNGQPLSDDRASAARRPMQLFHMFNDQYSSGEKMTPTKISANHHVNYAAP